MRNRLIQLLSLLAVVAHATTLSAAASAAPPVSDVPGIAFFEQKIRPVLIEHCYRCHSADALKENKLKGGLLVDSRAGLLKGGDVGPSIVPGDPAKSLLIAALKYESTDLEMPPKGKLPEAVIADFVKWVEMGSPDPRDGTVTQSKTFDIDQVRAQHWAFQPLREVAVPSASDKSWGRTAIDAFILKRLEEINLRPAPEAAPLTWLRRVHLDLTGLPPTPQEQQAFLDALTQTRTDKNSPATTPAAPTPDTRNPTPGPTPDPYSRVVDDLLARPQYGERWARHWLDVVRYAETKGYERDDNKPHTWRYRDWVIDAFNSDMPYNRFITEQLAGDEVENADSKTQTATTFLALGPYDTIANDGARARYDQLDDILGTTAVAFLGQTLQCARCHDHKFEPLSQEDYHRLLAAFEPLKNNDLEHSSNGRPIGGPEERKAHEERVADHMKPFAPMRDQLDQLILTLLEQLEKEGPREGKARRLEERHFTRLLPLLRTHYDQRTKEQREQLDRERGRIDEALREFASADELAKLKELRDTIARLDKDRPQELMGWVPQEQGNKPGKSHLLIRGEAGKRGKEVAFGLPLVLEPRDSQSLPQVTPTATTSGRRLWLAQWMTNQGQALVARVMVNRIWQYHFGQGFMSDANDFGVKADPPTHPELLNWLANDFVAGGWQMKRLHKQIVLSSVYRQGSNRHEGTEARRHEGNPELETRNFASWPTHRLEAEAIRDSILAISGRLNPKMHGPSIFPPFDNKVVGDSSGVGWGKSDESEASRRSVYVYQKRAIPLPELFLLGLPDSSVSCAKRAVSTTPVQSLLLLNGKFADQHAKHLADRLRGEAGEDRDAQVNLAYALVLCRQPTDRERQLAMEFLAGGEKDIDGLAAYCLVLMNTNEFVYRN